MKSGISGELSDPSNEFPYWVLPDKPMEITQNVDTGVAMGIYDPDATAQQTRQITEYLLHACTEHWTVHNHRFYFSNEDDWEMFKTMCLIGWA
jgi:hypothetical protein